MKKNIQISAGNFGLAIASVALLAFVFGKRVEQYDLFSNFFKNDQSASSLPEDLDYSTVEEVYDTLRANYDGELELSEVMDGLKQGLARSSSDPYTTYLNSNQVKEFKDGLNGTFSGIGAEISLENEVITVVSPIDGFPAQQAGLRPKDSIVKIDDEDTFGLTVEEAVLKIRGPVGTDVKLTIQRAGEEIDVVITRQSIVVPSVEYEVLDGNIGYMRISRFAEDTKSLVKNAAEDLDGKGVSGVILDLRNNSGGLLSAAVDVSSLWLDGQVVVEQREHDSEDAIESLKARSGAVLGSVPTVVLINEGSASASEIVAGALQDYEKATLVGKTSFGKGSVQSLEPLNDGSQLKVTIARWYTPNGRTIDQEGVQPDIEVDISDEDYDNDRDPQKDRAIAELKN